FKMFLQSWLHCFHLERPLLLLTLERKQYHGEQRPGAQRGLCDLVGDFRVVAGYNKTSLRTFITFITKTFALRHLAQVMALGTHLKSCNTHCHWSNVGSSLTPGENATMETG